MIAKCTNFHKRKCTSPISTAGKNVQVHFHAERNWTSPISHHDNCVATHNLLVNNLIMSSLATTSFLEHSSLVANIRHLKTGYVSPQSYVVFNDLFETVFSSGVNNALDDSICKNLYGTSCEIYVTDEYAHTTILYTSLLRWMKSGWMQKVVSRVKLSFGRNTNKTKN